MKKILFLVILLISTNIYSWSPGDIGIPNDKYMHTLSCYAITNYVEDEWNFEWWQSLLLINVLGALKEYSDTQFNGSYDYKDIMANNIGWLGTHISFKIEF